MNQKQAMTSKLRLLNKHAAIRKTLNGKMAKFQAFLILRVKKSMKDVL